MKKVRSEADASRVSKPPSAAADQRTRAAGRGATPSLSYVVPTIGVPEHLEKCLASIYRDGQRLDGPAELVVVCQAPRAGETEGAGDAANAGDAGDGEDAGDARGSAALRELCGRLAAARPGAIDGPPRIVELPRPAGFARAANNGIAVSSGDWIALVNDDVVLEAGWARRLLEAVGDDARVAAAQGINVVAGGGSDDGEKARVDGAGLAWNRRLQAIQPGRGEALEAWIAEVKSCAGLTAGAIQRGLRRQPARAPAHPVGDDVLEAPAHAVYGVSATAAIYRRDALAEVSGGGEALRPFEERLDSYYEDVELADRLHAAGYGALLALAARAEHAGALSSRSPRAARRRTRRVYANRLLVLARGLGRGFWPRLPVLLGRDVVDALRRPGTGPLPGDLEPPGIVDLVCAWGRATRLLPRFAHFGQGRPALERGCTPGAPAPSPAAAGGGVESRRPSGRHRFLERSEADASRALPKAGGGAGAPGVERLHEGDGDADTPLLSAVAPHWHDEDHLAVLVRDWPGDERFELIVVDNGSDRDPSELAADRANVRVLNPGRNLGFAAAVNRGAAETGADLVLILNPDAAPQPGALEALVQGIERHPGAAGLAPRLVGADGGAQGAWQLRRLPTFGALVGYCCFVEPAAAPAPPAGAPVEQPAACALLLRRTAFENAGGMDERFWPAWFEDVDLARRLADRGEQILYWPEAIFRHGLGGSVPRLGYGGFLAAYYRNLDRYARKHHGAGAALLLRVVLVGAAFMRVVLLPLRCPGRARGRGEALAGLWRLAVGAASGWRSR